MGRCPFWVTNNLGGCPLPARKDLQHLGKLGVTLLVSLVESHEFSDLWAGGEREFLDLARELGIRVIRLPTPDFGAPDPMQACQVLREMKRELDMGGKVVVHCRGGIGRTGTMLAAHLIINEGMRMQEALELLEKYGAGPQSEEQRYFLVYLPLQCGARRELVF